MRLLLLAVVFVETFGARWVALLERNTNPHDFAEDHHFEYVGPLTFDHNYHIFQVPDGSDSRSRAESIFLPTQKRSDDPVIWGEEQVKKRRFSRAKPYYYGSRTVTHLPGLWKHLINQPNSPTSPTSQKIVVSDSDPLYGSAWHLHGQSPSSIDVDLVTNYTGGSGVRIVIVDDGLEHTHPEIRDNYDAQSSYNFNGGDVRDPTPKSSDGHGTSAAGVAAGARHNGHCGHGVAFKAKVAGVRLIAEAVDDATESEALSINFQNAHIYSNSWGPADTGKDMDTPGRLTRETLARLAGGGRGRNGKGSIYVWASGNGKLEGDSCAYDGYAGNPYVNSIGAVDVTGQQSWYSEGCANLIAVTPSSGSLKGIVTADLMGAAGYTPTECTDTFGGTSSAAPLGAGIIALLLERRPDLGWRDVKYVLAKYATQINPTDKSWRTNAAGFHHSNIFGFGLLKVPPLLNGLARHTTLLPPQKQVFSPTHYPHDESSSIIRSKSKYGTNATIHLNDTGIRFVEMVILSVMLRHSARGNVRISIFSPSGDECEMAPFHPDTHTDYPNDGWSISSLHFFGDSLSDGAWKINFADKLNAQYEEGRIEWIRLGVWGH